MLQTIERFGGADWTNGAFGKGEDVAQRAGAPEAVRPEKGDRTVRRIQPAERCCRTATIASSAHKGKTNAKVIVECAARCSAVSWRPRSIRARERHTRKAAAAV